MQHLPYKIKPWAHQLKTIERSFTERDLAIFHEMGTGKTGTVINILRHKYKHYGRLCKTLIFAPVSVCRNWQREFTIHADVADKYLTILEGTGRQKYKALRQIIADKPSQIIVTNYESVDNDDLCTLLQLWKPEILVCDESHLLKNHDSKRGKKILVMADGAAHRYIMTGTPILNSAMDIWMQHRILDKGETFGRNTRHDFFDWRRQYFQDKNEQWSGPNSYPKWVPKKETHSELSRIMYKKASRALKRDCLDLPPLVKECLHVKFSDQQAKYYKEMCNEFLVYLAELKANGEPKAVIANQAVTKSIRLQQIVSGFVKTDEGEEIILDNVPRIKELERLLEELTPDHKVIVWAVFKKNYEMIAAVCKKLKINYAQLHGGVTIKNRDKALQDFEHDKECRVMIANQAAGGTGINMIQASYAIYYTRSFKLGDDLQSEARNHRGGSEIHDKITRIDLVTKGTIDEYVIGALKNKQAIADVILDWKL